MHERDGSLLGYLEIDEPDNHKVPDDDTLRAIEVFSDLAAIAIQNAELYSEVQEDRKKIELLIDLIGHDVNNYAQAVSGFVELAMARKGVPEPSRKSLAKALDQVWNLNKLVTNVKLFARVETAGGKDLQPMDIVGVVKDAFATAESCSPSKESELVLVNDDGKPKMSMMNDLAKDVFLNLFTNAIKFDAHEKVVVDVSIAEQREDQRMMWCISVADNGPGVDDELKTVIFDRFTQASGVARGSSGLGLHIAKSLVISYKGRIWVEDRVPGDRSKGSVFKVLLPKAADAI
jgi:signal transduction histidine kinase